MGDLSKHFSRSEFRCHGFGHPGHRDHATPVDPGLVELLELIRSHHGAPVRIVSGHRCAWWNARIGGATHSQHMAGLAADIPEGIIRPDDAWRLGAHGVGHKNGWTTHVDRRRDTTNARWSYD